MLKGKDGAGPKLKDFKAYVDSNEVPEIQALKHDVEEFAKEFPTIGFEKACRHTLFWLLVPVCKGWRMWELGIQCVCWRARSFA